jgi:heme/copper-type cytochrome/quinol oxidase subunit 4
VHLKRSLITFILSVILVIFSVFLPSKVNEPNSLQSIQFGYPVHFVQQNQGWMGYEGSYPHYFTMSWDGLDYSLERKVFFLEFVISILITWIVLYIITVAPKWIYEKLLEL